MSIKMSFIILTVLAILGGANFYLAKRFYQFLTRFFPALPFWVLIIIFLLLLLVLTLGFVRSMLPLPACVKHVLGVANAGWMGIFIYLLLSFLISDLLFVLLNLFFSFDRFYFLCFALILAASVCIGGFIHAGQIQQKNYDIKISGAEDMTVVLISDLHLGAAGSEKRLPKIVDKINLLNPDIVCIAGDFFDSDFYAIHNPDAARECLKKLAAKYGVWACFGNHDAGKTALEMYEFIQSCNIHLLCDQYTVIDNKLILAGRLDGSPIGGYGGMARKPLTLENADSDLPVVVMDHNPTNINEYGEEFDLILCGHTHKGQLFPAGLVTDRLFTVDYGYYRADEFSPHVIVTSGIGTWGMPMRVGSDCEVVKISICS